MPSTFPAYIDANRLPAYIDANRLRQLIHPDETDKGSPEKPPPTDDVPNLNSSIFLSETVELH